MAHNVDRLEKAAARASSGRRQQRDRSTDVESAILDAAELLLDSTPLHELFVADIIKEAGLSRATFYHYFASKFDVVAALLARTADDLFEAVQPWMSGEDQPPEDRLRSSLQAAASVWAQHSAVTRSAVEHWTTDPEIRELWLALLERFGQGFIDLVDRDRANGLAPAGSDSGALITALVWSTERVFYVSSVGTADHLPDIDTAVDVVFDMWSAAIYGATSAASKPAPKRRKTAA